MHVGMLLEISFSMTYIMIYRMLNHADTAKQSIRTSEGVTCLSKTKMSVFVAFCLFFAGSVFSSCNQEEETPVMSQAVAVDSLQAMHALRATRSSGWTSLPEWNARPISSRFFDVKQGHKVLVTVVNTGKHAVRVFVNQYGSGRPDEIIDAAPAHVQSLVIKSSGSNRIHLSIYNGDGDGSPVGSASIRVSYMD